MKNVKVSDVKRKWHLVDASNKSLGRVATQVVQFLIGKNKAIYTPYMDTGDNVVVVNAKRALLTGKKEKQKKYYRHSGYPGGLKTKTASQVRNEKPEHLMKHAIVGMMPKTKLGREMIKKLYIFQDSEHPYESKFNDPN